MKKIIERSLTWEGWRKKNDAVKNNFWKMLIDVQKDEWLVVCLKHKWSRLRKMSDLLFAWNINGQGWKQKNDGVKNNLFVAEEKIKRLRTSTKEPQEDDEKRWVKCFERPASGPSLQKWSVVTFAFFPAKMKKR